MPANPRPSWPYLLVGGLSYPFLHVLFRYQARGLERVPQVGGYVLAANHLSNADPWPLGMALFPRRYLRFMAKSELFWFPLAPFIAACGAFPVRRGKGDAEAVATAIRLCRQGHIVVMFPEGTRRQKGLRKEHVARWRSGAARIALEAGVPLVPAGISGTDGLSHLAQLRVAYGDPIELADLGSMPLEDAAHAATDRLTVAIAELEGTLS